MKCDDVPLLELIRGDLDRRETESVVDHVETCAVCRERLQIMASLDRLLAGNRPERNRQGKSWVLMAAGLLIGLALPLSYLFSPSPVPAALVEAYPYFPLETRSSAPPTPREKGLAAYAQGDFKEAEGWLSQLPEEAETAFFRGVSRFYLDKLDACLEDLTLASRLSEEWRDPAVWYQAHALLRMGRNQEAVLLLRSLQASPAYREKAAQLLESGAGTATGGRGPRP